MPPSPVHRLVRPRQGRPVDEARRQNSQSGQQCGSTLILITMRSNKTWNAEKRLREQKGQVLCERKFSFIKDPLFLNALLLDTPEHLEALGYANLMAALR